MFKKPNLSFKNCFTFYVRTVKCSVFCRPGMCKLPKQYPAVPAMTWPPFPALWTSLMRPPVPVVAPLNGATPGGQMRVTMIIWKKQEE